MQPINLHSVCQVCAVRPLGNTGANKDREIEEISLTLQGVEDEVGAGRAREDQEDWSFGVNRVWSSRSGSARRSSRELEKRRP